MRVLPALNYALNSPQLCVKLSTVYPDIDTTARGSLTLAVRVQAYRARICPPSGRKGVPLCKPLIAFCKPSAHVPAGVGCVSAAVVIEKVLKHSKKVSPCATLSAHNNPVYACNNVVCVCVKGVIESVLPHEEQQQTLTVCKPSVVLPVTFSKPSHRQRLSQC